MNHENPLSIGRRVGPSGGITPPHEMTGVEFSEVTVNRGAVAGELCHEDALANHSPRTGRDEN